jgi:uncharacterized membrane protein YuzA (DUF378 family)
MVSDSMAKFVFLSLHVAGVFFPLRKANSHPFFTVKQFFLKIKAWPKETAGKRRGKDMKSLDATTAALVIIGALNWGLAGVFHLDLVALMFGMRFGETSALSAVVYGLVGLAGLYQAVTWKNVRRREMAGARA